MASRRTKDGKLGLVRVEDLLISAFADSEWPDDTWREYCDLAVALSGSAPAKAAITFAPKAGPTIAQRKVFADDYGERLGLSDLRYAILLSDSMLVRGTFTATSWLVRHRAQMKAYKPSQLRDALLFVQAGERFALEPAIAEFDKLLIETGWGAYRKALRPQ
jgi:hypothetical protein